MTKTKQKKPMGIQLHRSVLVNIMILASAIFLLHSCTKERDNSSTLPCGEVRLTVTASIGAATRTQLAEADGSVSPLNWSSGDRLCIVDESTGVKGYLDVETDGVGTPTAVFSGTLSGLVSGQTYRFWYLGQTHTPATGSTTQLIDLSSQEGTADALASNAIMTGEAAIYLDTDDGDKAYASDLTLTHQLCIAHFALTNSATATSLTIGGSGVTNGVTCNLCTGTLTSTPTATGSIAITGATGTTNFTNVYATFVPATLTPVFIIGTASTSYRGTLPKTTFVAGCYYRGEQATSGSTIKVYCNRPLTGALTGLFSVSALRRVRFSQGNLRYTATTQKWTFANFQYNYLADTSGNLAPGSTQSKPIDLYGWGTSGALIEGSTYALPYQTAADVTNSTDWQHYYAFPDAPKDIAGTPFDWGAGCAISNGGNQAGLWRTLTSAEWQYLLTTRTNAATKRATATVVNVKGLLILPDSWSLPTGCAFTATTSDFTTNTYTAATWTTMQAAGAVFLPCGGYRSGTTVNATTPRGFYWSSTAKDQFYAYCLFFGANIFRPAFDNYRFNGYSVRLVQDE